MTRTDSWARGRAWCRGQFKLSSPDQSRWVPAPSSHASASPLPILSEPTREPEVPRKSFRHAEEKSQRVAQRTGRHGFCPRPPLGGAPIDLRVRACDEHRPKCEHRIKLACASREQGRSTGRPRGSGTVGLFVTTGLAEQAIGAEIIFGSGLSYPSNANADIGISIVERLHSGTEGGVLLRNSLGKDLSLPGSAAGSNSLNLGMSSVRSRRFLSVALSMQTSLARPTMITGSVAPELDSRDSSADIVMSLWGCRVEDIVRDAAN